MEIADRCVASFHYTLTDDAGQVIDSSSGRDPLSYLHGAGNIVAGLEKALAGKQAGDKLKVDVAPEEGYGIRHDGLVQQVPRDAFQGIDNVQPGMQFQAQTGNGPLLVTVTEVGEGTVTVDGNHPLAGKTLHFDVEVTEVREATADEQQHGHAHGAGGAHG
ncbi:FKBP-type peptidyl-prolyl cis-trans isomerase [Marilutibacter chinensis]|uniref:Peptidyl-prolyl cis-trans isomerase n=1 Tax=Marilutibacter chinensis TaxID=2912247 RepID=A0ABS9HVG4_9GAMM|nr:peptidylprolyl isomerase [Lysobacter chinensis]MCF7222491.1 peptidylprolyl isomerase [Lysobacter chinensis]